MANLTDTPNESALEPKAGLKGIQVLAARPHEKTSDGPGRRPLYATFLLASVLAAVMIAETNALEARSGSLQLGWFGPACTAQELDALDVIEERGEVIGTSTEQVVEAVRRFLQARKLCLSGREDEGIALYQNAINTALGFDSPIVNAKARATSAAAIQTAVPSR